MEWLNYHHLYYFWTVMKEGSITAASSRLRPAQSTISAQLTKLEESFGGKLFNRPCAWKRTFWRILPFTILTW